MFIYTEKYNESESDIQNNNLYTKYTNNAKVHSNISNIFEHFEKVKTNQAFVLLYI